MRALSNTLLLVAACSLAAPTPAAAEELGARWGTAGRERAYYPIVRIPTPPGEVIEAGAFCELPDGRMAVGTRRGDIFFLSGIDEDKPEPDYHRFATGLDEIFGLAYKDGALYVTQSCELTRVTDRNNDGRADHFETISDAWGYANYHEYAFGSSFDEQGNIHVALGLSQSYNSRALFRGWAMTVSPDRRREGRIGTAGHETLPIASGLRSPAGIGPNEHGQLVYIESQGPWNSSCSLKALTPGTFHGHPISYNWYEFAPHMGPAPVHPRSGSRIVTEHERVPELVPYAVVFPYIRMGRSISGFTLDHTGGKFGPFQDQLFLGDFSLGVVMRATTEQVNGVWQGACYPFREGLSTGLLDVEFTPGGSLVSGGTGRGWPVRGLEPFALERIDWTGEVPFEIKRITIAPDGFDMEFTRPVDPESATAPGSYTLGTFTHIYHGAYGGPEVDQTRPELESIHVSEADARHVHLKLGGHVRGHVYEFDLHGVRSREGEQLLHNHAFYTVNEVPEEPAPSELAGHPLPEDPRWIRFEAGEGPGQGKHIVFIAADQEYRSEQSLPMLARMLALRHGFHTTVLFSVNAEGLVDPTKKIKWEDKEVVHHIPGIEHLAEADLMVLFSRLITLPADELAHIYEFLDAGRPIIGLRTANHGFIGFEYEKDGKRINFGEDVLGGSFRSHHGRWHADSTRGLVVPESATHPVLLGVDDVWGPSDVYRTYEEGAGLPEGCLPLLMGQPLMARSHDDPINPDLIPLPVAWVKNWTGASGRSARVFHSTMGSAKDFQSEGLRRLFTNAAYWCLRLEDEIRADSSVAPVGRYAPLASGFNYPKLDVRPRPVSAYAGKMQRLGSGMGFTEGPVWVPARDELIFSDIPNSKLMRWTAEGGVEVWKEADHPNGNLLDLDGRLLTCLHGARQLVRHEEDSSLTVLAEHHDGKRLNSPNDVAQQTEGTLWFTDPPWGLDRQTAGKEQPGHFVYRRDPDGKTSAVITSLAMPNGIALSPDERVLYVADTGGHRSHPDPSFHQLPPTVTAYALGDDNELAPEPLFVIETGCDGMCVDTQGNIYTTGRPGVSVWSPSGASLGVIEVPEHPANVCFGGPRNDTLFITARTSLYSLRIDATGVEPRRRR